MPLVSHSVPQIFLPSPLFSILYNVAIENMQLGTFIVIVSGTSSMNLEYKFSESETVTVYTNMRWKESRNGRYNVSFPFFICRILILYLLIEILR